MRTLTALTLTALLTLAGCGTSDEPADEATSEATATSAVDTEWFAYYAQVIESSHRVTEMYEDISVAAEIGGERAASLCKILAPEAKSLADDFLGSPDPELNVLAETWQKAFLVGMIACSAHEFGVASDAFEQAVDYMNQMTAIVEGRR